MNDIAVPNYDNVLTEDSRQQTMTKHRKHGFKSAGNATRYSKVAAAQYLRWTRQNRPPDHDYFRSQHGRYNLTKICLPLETRDTLYVQLMCTVCMHISENTKYNKYQNLYIF